MVTSKDSLWHLESGLMQADVSPLGGTIARFSIDKKEIFFPQVKVGEKDRGGCPMCAPWFGSSPRGKKKHGYLRDMTLKQEIRTPDEIQLGTGYYGSDTNYPWWIQYLTKVVLRNDSFFCELNMFRGDDSFLEPAPILPAFHPYFACDDASKVTLEIEGKILSDIAAVPSKIPLYSDRVIIGMPDRKITMILGGAFTPLLSHLALWTDNPSRYICVEPILYNPKHFDTPDGCSLKHNEDIEIRMQLEVAFH